MQKNNKPKTLVYTNAKYTFSHHITPTYISIISSIFKITLRTLIKTSYVLFCHIFYNFRWNSSVVYINTQNVDFEMQILSNLMQNVLTNYCKL